MGKCLLSERDICTQFITPALVAAGWDAATQIREEVGFTKGRIIVRGKLVTRGRARHADYVLYFKPNIPVAIFEAKDNNHSVGDGIQQALDYAEALEVPFAFSSNGDGFLFHDRTGTAGVTSTRVTSPTLRTPERRSRPGASMTMNAAPTAPWDTWPPGSSHQPSPG